MNKKPTYKHLPDEADYLRYLSDAMSPAERHRFERQVAADPFASEALEGLEKLPSGNVKDDLDTLRQVIGERKRGIFIPVYRMAATILLVAGITVTGYLVLRQSPDRYPVVADRVADSASRPGSLQPAADEGIISESLPISVEKNQQGKDKKASVEEDITSDAEQGAAAPIAMSWEEQSVPRERAIAAAPYGSRKRETSQSGTMVSGRVIDATNGEPIAGAAVYQENKGTTTDADGYFALSVPDTAKEIQIQYLGYTQESLKSRADKNLVVPLEPEAYALSEVEVVGYGTVKKEDLTGAVSVTSTDVANAEKSKASVNRTASYSRIDKIDSPYGRGITLPEPSVGKRKYNEYLRQNVRYSSLPASKEPIEITTQFIVRADGKTDSFKATNSPGTEYTNEVKRVIQNGPAWSPGTEGRKPADMEVRMTIIIINPE